MEDFEKMLKWFIPLFIIEYILMGTAKGAITAFLDGSADSIKLLGWVSVVTPWLRIATHILVGVWLYKMAKKYEHKALYWCFFGLATGLISIVIFFVIRIYEQNKQPKKT